MPAQLLAQAGRTTQGSKSTVAQGNEVLDSVLTSLNFLKDLMLSVLILVLFYIIGKLIANRITRRLQEVKGESIYPDLIALINRLSVTASLFVGAAVVMQFIFGVDFLQVVGFFGLGISFAFKDLLENLIAGAVIILQNKVKIGDMIQVGSIKGKVMEIQTRAMILKAIDGTEIMVPNSHLMNAAIINFTAHHSRRIEFTVNVDWDADIEKAKHVILDVLQKKENVLKKPSPQVLVKNIGESTMVLTARFWIDPQNKSKSFIVLKSELIQEVKQALDQNGILIPYPLYSYLDKKREIKSSL